jgi:DNA-binding NtrC family response regulator
MTKKIGYDIVVVDDDAQVLLTLEAILQSRGHTVRVASNGFLALSTLRERAPEVLLSDLNMPGMSGFELLSIARRRYPKIKAIAMSGAYSLGEVPEGITADAFYAKGSAGISALLRVIDTVLKDNVAPARREDERIWICKLDVRQPKESDWLVSCPECLRPVQLPLGSRHGPQEERHCPHCRHMLRLAIVYQASEVDRTAVLVDSAGS